MAGKSTQNTATKKKGLIDELLNGRKKANTQTQKVTVQTPTASTGTTGTQEKKRDTLTTFTPATTSRADKLLGTRWKSNQRDVLIRDANAIQQTGARDPINSRKGSISDYNTVQNSREYKGNDLKLMSKGQLMQKQTLEGMKYNVAKFQEDFYKNRTEEEKRAQNQAVNDAQKKQGALGLMSSSGVPVKINPFDKSYYAAQSADDRNSPDEWWKERPEDYWDGNNRTDYDRVIYDSIYGDGSYDRKIFEELESDEEYDAFDKELDNLWDSLENGQVENEYQQAQADYAEKVRENSGDYGSARYKRTMDKLGAELQNRQEIERLEAVAPEGDWAYDPDAVKTSEVTNARIGRHAGKAASRTYNTTIVNGDRLDNIYYKANNPVIDKDISMSGQYYNLDPAFYMTPKQIETFNAYFLSGDRESAQAYYDALEPYLQSMKMQAKDAYEMEMSQNEYAPWMIGKRILTQPAAGIMGTAGMVAAALGNEEAQDADNELFYGMTRSNQNIQGARAQVWGKQFQDWFGDTELANNVGQWFNGIVYSMADNLVARGIGMGVGGALGLGETSSLAGNLIQFVMSSEATASEMYTNMKNGMDPSEAVIRAFGSGAIEWITEKYSTDRFFENFGNGNLAKQVVANFFPEAQEEGTGKIMETLLDEILSPIYGHESEFRQKVREYDEEYGEGNGLGRALLEYCGELGSEMLAGGVSGGVMGGVGGVHANIVNHNANVELGKAAIQSGTVDGKGAENTRENMATEATNEFKLLEAAEKLEPGSEARQIAKDIREGFKKGGKVDYAKFGQMVRAIMSESNEQIGNIAQTELGDVLKQQLLDAGEKEADAIELSQVLMQGIVDQALSPEMLLAIHDNANAMKLWKDYRVSDEAQAVQDKINPLQEAQKSVMDLLTEKPDSGITEDSVSGMMAGAQAATPEEIAEADANGKRTGSALEVIADGMYGEITGISTRNVTDADGKNQTVVEVTIGEGENERTVGIDAVKGLTEGAAQVLQVIANDRGQVIGENTAKALLQATQATKNVAGTVADAMKTMWAAAMEQKAPKTNLDTKTRDTLTGAIQKDMDAAEQKRIQNWRKMTPGNGTATYNGTQYGTKEFNDEISKLGGVARNEANVIGNYAKSMGVDVELYYDAEDSAKQGAFFGGQDGAGIRINLAGTINTQGAHRSAVATFAHEVTHNIEANSPTAYKALRSFVLQNMQKSGMNLQAELQHIMDNYAAHGENIDLNGAIAEMVAMGNEQVLTNETVAAELKQQDPTLFGKVRKAVNRLVNQIRGVKGDAMATSSRYARAMQNVADQMAKVWLRAYEEAKSTTAPAVIRSGSEEYSLMGTDPDTGNSVYLSNYAENTSRQIKQKDLIDNIQNVFSKNPILLTLEGYDGRGTRNILAQFDPTFYPDNAQKTDAGKLAYNKKVRSNPENRVKLNLAGDLQQIIGESINYASRADEKGNAGILQWHYFNDDIYYVAQGSDVMEPYKIDVAIKQKADGSFVYTYEAIKDNSRQTKKLSLMEEISSVNSGNSSGESASASNKSIAQAKNQRKGQRSIQDDNYEAEYRAAYERMTDARIKLSELKGELDDLNKRIATTKAEDMDALIAEIAEWEKKTGYSQLKKEYDDAVKAYEKANENWTKYIEQRDLAEEQEKIRESGLSEADWRRKQAINLYGYTNDFREAGYLLPNGRMLNFCGSKGQHYGMRGNDHRDIGQIYANKQGSEAMVAFMADGNIRIMAESPGIDISTAAEPTTAQYTAIRNMANRFADEEYFNLDFTDKNGNNVGNIEYEGTINPSRIVNDIRHYFKTGEVREQSTTRMFHGGQWSIRDDDYMAAVNSGDMEAAQRMVDQAAKNAGYKKEIFHGTRFNFNEFDIDMSEFGNSGYGLYFGAKSVADQYGEKVMHLYIDDSNIATRKDHNITPDKVEKAIKKLGLDTRKTIEKYGSVGNYVSSKDDYEIAMDLEQWANWKSIYGIDGNEFNEPSEILNVLRETLNINGVKDTGEIVLWDNRLVKSAEAVTYDDNGNIIPPSERFNKEKKDIRFSMQMPVEERADGLIAVHNLNAEQMMKTLKLGGFAMPSIAIIKNDYAHNRYGDISVVFYPGTIDPKASRYNKVYGGDAWTPTYPGIEYKINTKELDKIYKKVAESIPEGLKGIQGLVELYDDNFEHSINGHRGDVISATERNMALELAYLKDKGISIEYPMKAEPLARSSRFNNEQIIRVAEELGEELVREAYNGGYEYFDEHPEVKEKVLKALNDQWKEKHKDVALKIAKMDLYTDDKFGFGYMDSILQDAFRYFNNGINQEIDENALRQTLEETIDKEDYEQWRRELFKNVIEKTGLRNNKDLFTNNGNRRSWDALHDPETLENVVKIMRSEAEKGSNAFFSQSEMLALGTRDFRSIDEIRKHKNQLKHISDEEMSAAKTNIVNGFSELMDEMYDRGESNIFIARDRALQAMVEAVRNSRSAAGIMRELRQWHGLNITEDMGERIAALIEEVANLPTEYFEAKPQRAVGFEEIEKVIVPQETNQELLDALDEQGIPWETYDGTDEDRLRALNEQQDAMFSFRDDTDYDIRAWMETVPEWSLRTEAEKELLRKYGSIRRKGQMDQLRMDKIDAEIRRLEGMQGKAATSEGTPVTSVTVDDVLKANGIVQDGAMLKKNGVIIGSLRLGVLSIYDKYKDIRKTLENSGAFEYDEKTASWTAAPQNIHADEERDIQKRLSDLRIRKQNLQKVMDQTNEELAKITSDEGFGGMMYRQQQVLNNLAYNKTQAEVRDSIENMEKAAKRVQGIIDENRKKAEKLESSDIVKRFRQLLGTTTAAQTARELKKEYSSTWTAKQIQEYLEPIILKIKSGEDFQQDVEELAGILVNSDSRNTYEELEALRGMTITLGKGAQAELKAQNSSLKEVRARLAGTGITVKYGDRSTLEADIEDLRAEYPMIPELGDEKDALGNFLNWIDSMKSASAAGEFYDQRLAEAMAVITGKAAGAAKGIYMPNDPKAQRQVLAMMDFVKGLNAETQQAQDALQQVADEMGAMQKAGREARGKTGVLMRDVNVALDYYNRVSRIAVDEAKQKRTSAIIEQLKSKQAEQIIKNNEEWRRLIERDKNAQKQLEQNRKAQAHINTNLRRMYNLLKAPKGLKNIPEYMQGLAREVLGIFAKNDAEGGRRFLNATKDGLQEMLRILNAWEAQDGPFNSADLAAAEEAVTINLLNDLDVIREGIAAINTPVNGKNKLDTLQQRGITYRNIQEAVSEIYSAIRAEQEVQIGDRRVAVEDAAYKVAAATQGKNYREWTGKLGGGIRALHRAIISGNMTPEYFFRTVGNEGLNDLWDTYHWAENKNGLELAKAQQRLDEIAKQHGYDQWDMGQKIVLPLEGGETEVTLGQLMSLWATWKREKTLGPQMSEHLTKGGFYAEKDLRDGILGRTTMERTAHRVTEEDMAKVKDLLTEEQRKFVDDVVLFMSRDMSELGNAASMAAYGIRMYKEKYYFPFQMWDGVKSRKSNDAGSAAGANDRAFHPSFSKSRMHGANNALVLGDFMQTAADHIAGMINYATMGLANESMQKVLNQQTAQGPYETMRNTRAILEEAYGKEVMQYLAELQMQLNGGAVRTSRSLGDKAISIFRKNAVAGSLSVALQQPLSYIRAATMINPKYLTKAALTEYWKDSYKERMAHSGVSVIKEMGRFDMALGQSAREYLTPNGKESTGRKIWEGVKEYSTILPELMDRWTWNRMWVAVKAEQAALHPEMDVKSDAFLDMVGERFNELMRRTQVYDSVLVKSANMRSDNYFVKSMTSFMAEPTLTMNVLADAVRAAKSGEKGGKMLLAKAGATFLLSAVLQAVFKGLMSTGRTPDEKKNWTENFLYRFFNNFQNEVDPLQLIPGYSDAITLLKDGKLQDDAMGALGKLFTAGQKGVDLLLGNGGDSWYRDLEDSVGQLTQLFSGLPLKNLMRDARAMWNWAVDQPYAKRDTDWNTVKFQTLDTFMNADNLIGVLMEKLGSSGYDTSNAAYYERIYNAKKAGDEQAAQSMIDYLLNGKGVKQETISSKMASMAKEDTSATATETAGFLMDEGKDPTSYVKEQLKAGKMSAEEARRTLQKANEDKEPDEIWWMVDRIQYQLANKAAEAPSGRYYRLWDAMDKNRTEDIRSAIETMTTHGVEEKNIKTQITKQYKAAYLAADADGKREIRDAIEKAYKLLGYTAKDADKVINKWK